jgi:hypothetical protein
LKPEDRGAGRKLLQLLGDRGQRRPGADADQRPSSRAERRAISLASLGSTWMTPVDRIAVEVGWDEAGADALDRVRAGLPPR